MATNNLDTKAAQQFAAAAGGIASQLKGVTTEAARAADALKGMTQALGGGKAAQETTAQTSTGLQRLIELLTTASGQLDKYAQNNQKLSGVQSGLGSVLTVLNQMQTRYEELDALQRKCAESDSLWEGTATGLQVLQSSVGAVNDVLSHFTDDTQSLTNVQEGLGKLIPLVTDAGKAYGLLSDALQGVHFDPKALTGAGSVLNGFGKGLSTATEVVSLFTQYSDKLAGTQEKLQGTLSTVTEAQRIYNAMQSSTEEGMEALRETTDRTGAVIGATATAIDRLIAKMKERKAENDKKDGAAETAEGDKQTHWGITADGLDEAYEQIEMLRGVTTALFADSETAFDGVGQIWKGFTDIIRANEEQQLSTQSVMSGVGTILQGTAGLLGENAGAWVEYGANVISAVASAIPQIVALTAANTEQASANATNAATGAASSVASIPVVGWIMAGVAIASVLAALATIPTFAAGGLAYGPTLGVFGEYAGAAHNPEVIAPLSKLEQMLQPAGEGGGTVRFRIEGRTLAGILEKENKYSKRTR